MYWVYRLLATQVSKSPVLFRWSAHVTVQSPTTNFRVFGGGAGTTNVGIVDMTGGAIFSIYVSNSLLQFGDVLDVNKYHHVFRRVT
jgi:hypothetical protein